MDDLLHYAPTLEDESSGIWPQLPVTAHNTAARVVVVDNELDYRIFLQSVLEGWGYEVSVASTGSQALEIIADIKPDLVLLDVSLPDISGVEVVGILKKNTDMYPFTPVLLHSGASSSLDVVAGFRSGADDYVTKPTNLQELEVRLRSMLRFKVMHDILLEREEELRVLNARLEAEATTDVLTGLANRRAFERALEREVEASRRAARPMSLILLDLDHFKEVNDSYGHPVGDEVLRQIAAILIHETRASDTVSRWGGEEFAILLPGTTPEAARRVAERIRSHAEHCDFVTHSGKLHKTVSLGIASHPENGITTTEIISSADTALYRSKANGRNQVSRSSTAPNAL